MRNLKQSRKGTVLVADDHGLYRKGLSLLIRDGLGFTAIIEAGTFDLALDSMAHIDDVALALFDLSMPGVGGPESLAVVKQTYPDTRVVVISAIENRDTVLAAIATGLNGYLPKSMSDHDILSALEGVLQGRIYIPSFMSVISGKSPPTSAAPAEHAEGDAVPAERAKPLSPRQHDVLRCICRGFSNKEIARELDIAEGTVKIHVAALFAHFGVRNRTELATKNVRMEPG